MTIEDAWKFQEEWAKDPNYDSDACCLLDLRRRVEALEQRAAASATEPTPAPAADRPLWKVMDRVFYDNGGQDHDEWVATINAVADWLSAREHCGAASALRSEALRAREGA